MFISETARSGAIHHLFSLQEHVATAFEVPVTVGIDGQRSLPDSLRIRLDVAGTAGAEAYRLQIKAGEVRITGNGAPGLCHGLQTFIQLLRQFGLSLPCLILSDEPAYRYRGYYLDISRGKVPTLDTLKQTANRLAALKFNQFQLYVEHVFDFPCDPAIGRGCDPLRPEDILALDAYCHERHIELVPSLACFGHMGRILSLPAYRRLAEVEWPAPDWEQATWRQRLRGATINPYAAGTRELFSRLFEDFLPLFRSSRVNICGDETYDLGRGPNRRRAKREGIAALYLHHLSTLRALAARHGKHLMFWGDIMLQHPQHIRKIPKDCTVLDWGYEPTTPFKKAGTFVESGLPTYVCPATRGYRSVFNQVELARGNIAGYARTGQTVGAEGLLVTDWGDMGHFNLLAASLHGMALAAAKAWNPRADGGNLFDKAFSLQVFGDPTATVARLYRQAGSTRAASWPFLLQSDWDTPPPDMSVASAERVQERIPGWLRMIARLKPAALVVEHDLEELALACEAIALNAEKRIIMAARAGESAGRRKRGVGSGRRFEERIRTYLQRYRKAWLAANRRSGINEVSRALRRMAGKASG